VAPQTGTAILVLAAFVLPGFVTVLLRERTYHARAGRDPFELLLTALAYSAVIYLAAALTVVLVGIPTDVGARQVAALYRGQATLAGYTGLATAGLVVGPGMVAIAGKAWSDSEAKRRWTARLRLNPQHATRSAWEYWFSQRRSCLIRATLEDGRVVGGVLGEHSMAGRGADHRDIFLEERWEVGANGWFTGERATGTRGLYLAASAITSLEMYEFPIDGTRDDL
jgi:membrane protein implicated in regulation of membrane protease activity